MNALERHSIVTTGPWILYDGTCGICTGGATWFGTIVQRRGYRLAPLQSDIGSAFRIPGTDEMQLIARDGTILGGAEAFAQICRGIWWARPVAWLWYFSTGRRLLRMGYRWLADNRYLVSGMCELPDPTRTQKTKPTHEENPYALDL